MWSKDWRTYQKLAVLMETIIILFSLVRHASRYYSIIWLLNPHFVLIKIFL